MGKSFIVNLFMKENVMKSIYLFKQAILITAVSSLALSSAMAMEEDNHSELKYRIRSAPINVTPGERYSFDSRVRFGVLAGEKWLDVNFGPHSELPGVTIPEGVTEISIICNYPMEHLNIIHEPSEKERKLLKK